MECGISDQYSCPSWVRGKVQIILIYVLQTHQSLPSYLPLPLFTPSARTKPNVAKQGLRQNFRQVGSDVQ